MNRESSMKRLVLALVLAVLLAVAAPLVSAGAPPAAAIEKQVYFNDFDGGLVEAPQITSILAGVTTTESVQGYDGLGSGDNVFGGSFLRNTTGGHAGGGDIGTPGEPTRLTLTGLPPHTTISIGFLLGIIDSWDGSAPGGCTDCHPDILTVTVDGIMVFSEAFGFSGPVFTPPPGAWLSYGNLGFNPDFGDAAYDMNLVPSFNDIPHLADTVTIEWIASGEGWQGDDDESWAIDNVTVSVAKGRSASACNGLLKALEKMPPDSPGYARVLELTQGVCGVTFSITGFVSSDPVLIGYPGRAFRGDCNVPPQ